MLIARRRTASSKENSRAVVNNEQYELQQPFLKRQRDKNRVTVALGEALPPVHAHCIYSKAANDGYFHSFLINNVPN